jgi:hypothetical protein
MSERSERINITVRSAQWCIARRPDHTARRAMVDQ